MRQLNTTTWKEVGPPLPHPSHVRQTAYSSDGRLIFTADASGITRIWHPQSGKRIGPGLKGNCPTVSPDNRDFALVSTDGYRCLYSMPTPWEGEVEQAATWVEGLTGQKPDERGVLHPTLPALR